LRFLANTRSGTWSTN